MLLLSSHCRRLTCHWLDSIVRISTHSWITHWRPLWQCHDSDTDRVLWPTNSPAVVQGHTNHSTKSLCLSILHCTVQSVILTLHYSVRLSVCMSVTLRYCAKTAKHIAFLNQTCLANENFADSKKEA